AAGCPLLTRSGHRPLALPKYSPESIGYGQPICGAGFMKRRATKGGKASGTLRSKTAKPKRRTAATVGRLTRASGEQQPTSELAEARRLLAGAFEQQTATADVL